MYPLSFDFHSFNHNHKNTHLAPPQQKPFAEAKIEKLRVFGVKIFTVMTLQPQTVQIETDTFGTKFSDE
jgi:hypothetical protein